MIRFLKLVKKLFWGSISVALIGCLIFVSVYSNKYLAPPRLQYDNNISNLYSKNYKKSVAKSRYSAVLINSPDLLFRVSSLSGTYFIANGEPYVITAAHGISGPCFLMTISHEQNYHDCEEYTVIDRLNDYAIIKLSEKIPNRDPVRIPEDLPRGSQWAASYSILNKIIYTGYPNSIGPLTLKGDVVGYTGEDYLYVFSHAYMGSSGSGVFSTKGKYIGIVTAIDIGQTEYGVDILENVVLVTPAFKVDWSAVLD